MRATVNSGLPVEPSPAGPAYAHIFCIPHSVVVALETPLGVQPIPDAIFLLK